MIQMQIFFVLFVKISPLKVGLVSLDSGFCQKKVMDYPEAKKLNYIIAAKFTRSVQRITGRSDFWLNLNAIIEICDKTCKSGSWWPP
jgi:hypothetical protein